MKKILISALAATLFFTLTGCQEEIFHEIRDEIELEDSTIGGDINSIVRYGDYLVLENGDIYYKNSTANYYGAWSKDVNSPNDYTYKVAADENYLYALGADFEEDTDEGENVIGKKTLYCKNSISGAWTTVCTIASSTSATLFCTNTPQPANRKAYIRIGSSVYALSGTTTTAETSNGAGSSTLGCAFLAGTVYFVNYLATGSNETASTEATYIYYVSGDNLYYRSSSSSDWSSGYDLNCDTVKSLSYTSDYFVLGTTSGLLVAPHTSAGIPSGASTDDFANVSSTLSSYYIVDSVLAVNPSLSLSDNAVYGSATYSGSSSSTSAVFDNIGLWAYYASRGKWNRE
ncbi:MAG: hypothetical protein K6E51_01210 [Treponema sp.]|nr:hypothetical protein [Treponema sp.]